MCQYSLEGYPTRNARKGETLYAVNSHMGAFADKPGAVPHPRDGSKLVCIKYGTKLTINKLKVQRGSINQHHAAFKYLGKRVEVTLIKTAPTYHGRLGRHNGDSFEFADGSVINSFLVLSPLQMPPRAKPVRKHRGMVVIGKAIDEAIATSDPKEGEADPTQPTQNPVQAPAPTPPTEQPADHPTEAEPVQS